MKTYTRHAYRDARGTLWFIDKLDCRAELTRWTLWRRDKSGTACMKECLAESSYDCYFAALAALDAFAACQHGWLKVQAPE